MKFAALLSCILLASAQNTYAQTPTANATPSDKRNSVSLSKVFYDLQAAEPKGKYKTGNWCISHGAIKLNNHNRTEMDHKTLDFIFVKAVEAKGYKVASESQDMFADSNSDAKKANFLIGANVIPDTIDICDAIGPKIKGTFILAMEFQLYDVAAGQVVGKFPVTGTAFYPTFQQGQVSKLLLDAFANGVETLFASGQLDKYLGAPVPPPPPVPSPAALTPAALSPPKR